MRGQQVLDLAGHLDTGGGEHDQVVTDSLEIGDEMRGEHHADVVIGDHLHECSEELAPGKRIQSGHGFVEEEKLGSLGDRHREGELRPLATGEGARPLVRIEIETGDPLPGEVVVPARIHLRPEAEVVGDAQPSVRRRLLSHEPDAAELGRALGRSRTEDLDRAHRRRQQAHREL